MENIEPVPRLAPRNKAIIFIPPFPVFRNNWLNERSLYIQPDMWRFEAIQSNFGYYTGMLNINKKQFSNFFKPQKYPFDEGCLHLRTTASIEYFSKIFGNVEVITNILKNHNLNIVWLIMLYFMLYLKEMAKHEQPTSISFFPCQFGFSVSISCQFVLISCQHVLTIYYWNSIISSKPLCSEFASRIKKITIWACITFISLLNCCEFGISAYPILK